MVSYDLEQLITVTVLLALCILYIYLLFVEPNNSLPSIPPMKRHFVIRQETQNDFEAFMKNFASYRTDAYKKYDDLESFSKTSQRSEKSGTLTKEEGQDDFFLKDYNMKTEEEEQDESEDEYKTNVPSPHFQCKSGWLTIRSEMNYKYLWMHTGDNMWMGACATMDTPLHRRSFMVTPLKEDCSDNGWVLLQEGDSKGYIKMVGPNDTDPWVLKIGSTNTSLAINDNYYHFLVENDGYVLNRGTLGYLNVMAESEYTVRGHSSGWNRNRPAKREYGALMHFQFINASLVQRALEKEEKEEKEDAEEDKKNIVKISTFPTSTEKRVISFGLYGSRPKYNVGAIRNMELINTYFPGWIGRFYITSDVPNSTVSRLVDLGAEVMSIPNGKGYASGMFWRFMVASDPTVDRFIVRDADSRLNARDRIAVEEWIESKYPVHIQRDHVNHCIVMNGGMWGGTSKALPKLSEHIEAWSKRDEYMADLHFLEEKIWPLVKKRQLAHDSYCCDRFPNARPYPSRRPITYQHVGQVFDEFDNPRLMDIDGFIRGVPVPGSCRKNADWIYG